MSRIPRLVTRQRAKQVVYRLAGLPVALRRHDPNTALGFIRAEYARRYWRRQKGTGWLDILLAALALPVLLCAGVANATARNGRVVARRDGRPIAAQVIDQLRVYFAHGILPPRYYMFSLYEAEARRKAGLFLHRFETKTGLYAALRRRPAGRRLSDKTAFEAHCREHGIGCVPTLLVVGRDGAVAAADLPAADLFVKPVEGKGGRGAERWEYVAGGLYASADGLELTASDLASRLASKASETSVIVQPRLRNHPELLDLTSGALCTVRMLTCLDELGRPEFIGAVFRMAVGPNKTVDNFHAGGIAAAVDAASGRLGQATDLGAHAERGWLATHPDTGAPIEGVTLPDWREAKDLALRAHQAFSQFIVVGWDLALLSSGPCLVEGNSAPDVDIMQRPSRTPLGEGRLAVLLAHHLRQMYFAGRPSAGALNQSIPYN